MSNANTRLEESYAKVFPFDQQQYKIEKMASGSGIRTQIALFEIYDFIKETQINLQENISKTKWHFLMNCKSLVLFLYWLLVFFEKPFWCYYQTSFYITLHKTDNECDPNVAVYGIPFLPPLAFRMIEVFLLISLLLVEYFIYKWKIRKEILKPKYIITEILLISSIIVCLLDIFGGLIFDFYPMVNFILRCVIVIVPIKSLRKIWYQLIMALWMTRTIFFILMFNLLLNSLIAFLLFSQHVERFSSFWGSLYAMFILLTTSNSPDVIMSTFVVSRLSVIFFIVYILLNLFIFLSVFKTLNYSYYKDINSERASKIIRVIMNKKDKYNKAEILAYVSKIKFIYSLNRKQFKNILGIFGLNDFEKQYIIKFIPKSEIERSEINKSQVIRFFTRSYYEIPINIFIVLRIWIVHVHVDSMLAISFEFFGSIFFILEFVLFNKLINIHNLERTKITRTIFFTINVLLFFTLIAKFIYAHDNQKANEIVNTVIKVLIFLLSIRIMNLLTKFNDSQAIFKTIRGIKKIFYILLASLYSYFFIFSTITMLIMGGTSNIINSKIIKQSRMIITLLTSMTTRLHSSLALATSWLITTTI